MRINRGCGCLLIVLAAANLLFALAAVLGLAFGEVSVQLSLLALAVFGANLVASSMLGLAGLRGVAVGGARGGDELDTEASIQGGADSGIDEGEE